MSKEIIKYCYWISIIIVFIEAYYAFIGSSSLAFIIGTQAIISAIICKYLIKNTDSKIDMDEFLSQQDEELTNEIADKYKDEIRKLEDKYDGMEYFEKLQEFIAEKKTEMIKKNSDLNNQDMG
jgi:hypothetical protein